MRCAGWMLVAALAAAAPAGEGQTRPDDGNAALMPEIDGDWWQVAGDPDLGRYTDPRQQPVDFGVWQAADGTWQLWSCIRHTKCGGSTRLFHRWEGKCLAEPNWTPCGIAMEADANCGETPGGLQAPHVIRHDGTYYMLYGDWQNVCLATGKDGKTFTRRVGPDGKTGMFSDGGNTRDPMVLKVHDTFFCYYTAHPGGRGADYCRTSKDLKTWSVSTVVARAGSAGSGPGSAECPHVVIRKGFNYLFRTQRYGRGAQTSVYASADLLDFGIDDDRYLVSRLPVAAPEIIHHEGQWYIASLMPSLKGIHIARLKWVPQPPRPVRGRSVFDLDDPKVRAAWRLVEGTIEPIFTTSRRQRFLGHYRHFIGTGERGGGYLDDRQVGVIESPPVKLEARKYIALVSGDTERGKVNVAILDVASGSELLRLASRVRDNTFQEHVFDATEFAGRAVRVRVVDRAHTVWGHVNSGGLFELAHRPATQPATGAAGRARSGGL